MSSLVVRSLSSIEEYRTYFRMADAAFSTQPSEKNVQWRMRFMAQNPDFRAEQLRGAFRNGQLMGGCTIHERVLRMGAARISTGCIGAVVTFPEYRKQGVATALMQDALEVARSNSHALLLLDGIPNFYARYGYIDIFDVTAAEVDRSAILAQPPGAYTIRQATVDDAVDILTLYNRHFSAYTSSFERSLDTQMYRLRERKTPPVAALSPQGQVIGYLLHGKGDETDTGYEIAANDGDALLALLHYHAHLFEDNNAPRTLHYLLPLDAPMTQWMIDRLEVPDTSRWRTYAQEWGVRSLTYHHRFTGWMGRIIDPAALMTTILPELQARWERSLARWSGDILLTVGEETYMLRIADDVQLVPHTRAIDTAYHLHMTAQSLIQCVFGYRQVSRLVDVSQLPNNARTALSLLFPQGHTWLPASDWF